MTQQKTRKQRVMFSVEQKLDYVKLMINEGYTNRQIIEISGAGPTFLKLVIIAASAILSIANVNSNILKLYQSYF